MLYQDLEKEELNLSMRTGALRSWRRNKVMRQEFRQKTGD